MNHEHTLDLTEKVAMRAEKAPNKKSIKWVIIKYLFLILILVVAIFGIYKIFFTDLALERLEADLAIATVELNKAVDDRIVSAKKLTHDQKVVEQKADSKCKAWLTIKSYKDSKGMPAEENDMCASTELTKTPVALGF